MWPQALQMTRDECRGILRRLELESYSQVISVFRAQGGLSESKAKLLEELRGIFHISQERHRAEARRVANDEQLCTIAEAISGPNTWQEWSREGRRSYPMLPRVAPQTALALIANNVATETASENAKLPLPADTSKIAEEQASATGCEISAPWDVKPEGYVLTDDPFKMPDIPNANKKNLKRNISDNQTGSNKKRILHSENSPSKQQQQQKQFQHITANSGQVTMPSSAATASNIKKLYHNHNNKSAQARLNQNQSPQSPQLQQQKQQKPATKKSAASVAGIGADGAAGVMLSGTIVTPGKRQATPAKSGRKSNSKLQEQKQLQQMQRQKQQHQQQQQQLVSQNSIHHTPHIVGGEGGPIDEFNNENKHAQPLIAASKKDITKNLTKLQLPSIITPAPPIAAGVTAAAASASPTGIMPEMLSNPAATISSSQLNASYQLNATIASNNGSDGGTVGNAPFSPMIHNKGEKQLSTPVQKIILEDRLSLSQHQTLIVSSSTATASVASISGPAIASTPCAAPPQIMTLPQISAAATKLRAINTTMLPPGTKVANTTKKVSGSTSGGVLGGGNEVGTSGGSSQATLFNITDGGQNANSTNVQAPPVTPMHTPPAIIQLQSQYNASVTKDGASSSTTATTPTIASSSIQQQQQPVQGKVLTTKILPMVLATSSASSGTVLGAGPGSGSGTGSVSNVSSGSSVNITKIDTFNNGATVSGVGAVGGHSGVGVSNASTSVLGTGTMIKNMGSTLLLPPGQSGTTVTGSNTMFSTLAAATSVFRKTQIIKTGTIGIGTSSTGKLSGTFTTTNSAGPQIISNIKLAPAHTAKTICLTNQQQQQPTTTSPFLQHQLKNINVKICASANGKVFIQPANTDGNAKGGKLHGTLAHKILPNAMVSSSGAASGGGSAAGVTSTTNPSQRIAIQKVQIFPASTFGASSPSNLTGSFHATAAQSSTQMQAATTTNALTLSGGAGNSNKGSMNMLFVPSAQGGTRPTSGTITLSKKPLPVANKVASVENVKPNLVIIGSSTTHQSNMSASLKATAFADSGGSNNKYNDEKSSSATASNQLITEDTPMDILNMPIIVDSGDGTNITMGNNIGDTVTLFSTSLVESVQQQQQQQLQNEQKTESQPSTIILGATDWEMELDQATAVAAASKAAAHAQYRQQMIGKPKQQRQEKDSNDGETIIIDDSFEDVIVEEQEEGDAMDITEATGVEGAQTEGTKDDDATNIGEVVGGAEGQEKISEKAYKILSENESGSESRTTNVSEKRDVMVAVGADRMEKTLNENSKRSTIPVSDKADDDETVEVIDDDENAPTGKSQKALAIRAIFEEEKTHKQKENKNNLTEKTQNNGEGNDRTSTEGGISGGYDEAIVADIDENTAIEYLEDNTGNNSQITHAHLHQVEKLNTPVDETVAAPVAIRKSENQSKIIALNDNAIVALAEKSSEKTVDAAIIVESETLKVTSCYNDASLIANAATEAIVESVNSNQKATGLQ